MPNDFTREEGELVGAIRPGPDGEPTFRIVRREARMYTEREAENVRPCEHHAFILDEKFATVTCGECKSKIDAFAALMLYAEWFERLKHKQYHAESAEKQLYVSLIRQQAKRQALTDDERAEIGEWLRLHYRASLTDTKKFQSRFEKVLAERRGVKRHARRRRPVAP
jgi:hypothetical protein